MIKTLFSFIFATCVVLPAFAEEAVSAAAATTPASSEAELRASLQREYVYLASQKQALTQQKARLQKGFGQRIGSAKAQTEAMQKEVVRLTAENDDNHEYLSNLERRKKELQKRGSSMESTFKKAAKSLNEFEAGLHFESTPAKVEVNAPEEMKFESFEALIDKSSELIASAAGVETFNSSFVDLDGKLVEGTVTRWGRSAAIGTVSGKHFVLGPNGEGLLKALEPSEAPGKPSLSVYVFESLNKMAKMRKAGGLTEKLADLSPILFLGMMLLLVLGLFMALIKV